MKNSKILVELGDLLKGFGQVIMYTKREFANEMLVITNGANFIENNPEVNFWTFFKTKSRIVHKYAVKNVLE